MDTTGYNLKYDFNYAGRRLIVWIRDSESRPLIDFISLSQTVFGFEEEDYAFRRLEPLIEYAGKVQNKMVVNEEGMKLFLEEHMTATFMDKLLKQFYKWFEALKRVLPSPVRKEIPMKEETITINGKLVTVQKQDENAWFKVTDIESALGIILKDDYLSKISDNNKKQLNGWYAQINGWFVNSAGLLELLLASNKAHIANEIIEDFLNALKKEPVQDQNEPTAEEQQELEKVLIPEEEHIKQDTEKTDSKLPFDDMSVMKVEKMLVRDTITFRKKHKIHVIVFTPDYKTLAPWYNLDQVAKACNIVEEDLDDLLVSLAKNELPFYVEDGEVFFPYHYVGTIMVKLAKDGTHKAQELLAATKASLSEAQVLLDRDIVPGDNIEDFTLGAIVLAEALRESCEICKWREIKVRMPTGVLGNKEILRRLWIHIEAAGFDDKEPNFEFKKTYVLARERYSKLMSLIEKDRRG